MAVFLKGQNRIWPNAVVPYQIDGDDFPLGSTNRKTIEWAISHWNSRCKVKFVPFELSPTNWVKFKKHNKKCQSKVGRQSKVLLPGQKVPPPQLIRCDLDVSVFGKGDILHEMGHTVGLKHEHQRPDRDEHISLIGDKGNFRKLEASSVHLLTEYDYLSIMHYKEGTYKDKNGKFLGKISVPSKVTVGQELRLSYLDIAAIERHYSVGGGDHWILGMLHNHG